MNGTADRARSSIYNLCFGFPPHSHCKDTLLLDFLGDLRRTHMCGVLRVADAGKKATLMGWVNRRRDHGNLLFIDLRDRTGVTQVVFNTDRDAAVHAKAETLRNEYVIAVTGT